MEEDGFKLKLAKCKFAAKYLGHCMQENKVSPTQENLVTIKNLKGR